MSWDYERPLHRNSTYIPSQSFFHQRRRTPVSSAASRWHVVTVQRPPGASLPAPWGIWRRMPRTLSLDLVSRRASSQRTALLAGLLVYSMYRHAKPGLIKPKPLGLPRFIGTCTLRRVLGTFV